MSQHIVIDMGRKEVNMNREIIKKALRMIGLLFSLISEII